jgi:uncharacterized protein (DUF433 family)
MMKEWITVDFAICGGKPVITGTRILVKNILGMVAGGYTLSRIIEAYPELTLEMVEAALEYAACVIDEEQVLAHA